MQLLRDDTVLEANRDVTEVKALGTRQATLMRDLLAASAKFEAVFNQSSIFAGIMDLQGRLREVNNLAVDWCGYTREQVLDRPVRCAGDTGDRAADVADATDDGEPTAG